MPAAEVCIGSVQSFPAADNYCSVRLKCNRSHPCENCVKRGDTLSCTYVQPDVKRRSTTSQNPSTPDEMQNRIGRLENLVLSLMTNGAQAPGPAAAMAAISGSSSVGSRQDSQEADADEDGDAQEESETEAVTRSLGVMKVDNNKCSFYVSDAHWVSVLNDVSINCLTAMRALPWH